MYSVKSDISNNWIGYMDEETVMVSFEKRWIFDSVPLAKVAIKKAINDGHGKCGLTIFRIEKV